MFIVFVYPIVDVRDFLNDSTSKLYIPPWPLAREEKEFVRYTGKVRKRPGGGIFDWSGEDIFADAVRGARYEDLPKRIFDFGDFRGVPLGRIRRFYSNGITNRFEIGIEVYFGFEYHLDQKKLFYFLNELLSIPMKIPIPMEPQKSTELLSLSNSLSKLYLIASSSKPNQYKPEIKNSWYVKDCSPMILLINQEGLKIDIPEYADTLDNFINYKIILNHFWIKKHNVPLRVWIINSFSKKNSSVLRPLKINLIRLHEEKECLKEVLRLIGQKKLAVEVGTQASDNLQAYLNESIRIINKKTNQGIPQSDILSSVFESEKIVNEGEEKTIQTQLINIRKNILSKVKEFTNANTRSNPIFINDNHGTLQVIGRAKTMTNFNVNVGDGSTVSFKDVIVAENVQNSMNSLGKANDDNLKSKLSELTTLVAKMTQELSVEKAREVTQDLRTLTEEATKEKPRKKWYELSAEGIKEAAKTCAEIAGPVISVVGEILKFLG